jgi:hypothetical protein
MTHKPSIILAVDDLDPGNLITVLDGDCCEAGCCEVYQQFKGVPMVVLGLNLPYIVCGLSGGLTAHIDTRTCDLMRVDQTYAGFFGITVEKTVEKS